MSDWIIKGALCCNAYTFQQADLWIRDGKIFKIAHRIRPKKDIPYFNARNLVVLPGWVYDVGLVRKKDMPLSDFTRHIRNWVKHGVTSYVVTIPLETSEGISQRLAGETARYFNSPIDYVCKVRMPYYLCQTSILKRLKKSGIRHVELQFDRWRDIMTVKWSEIALYLEYNRMIVGLIPPQEENEDEWEKGMEDMMGHPSVFGIRMVFPLLSKRHVQRFRKRRRFSPPLYETGLHARLDPSLIDFWLAEQKKDQQHRCGIWVPEKGMLHPVTQERMMAHIKWNSTNAARMYGIYPQKGGLTIGGDADLVFYEQNSILTDGANGVNLSYREEVYPVRTMIRGKWVHPESQVSSESGRGSCLHGTNVLQYNLM